MDADISFQQEVKAKLINVFEKAILPECVTGKQDPNNERSQKFYFSCKRPSFESIITWAPKGSWTCPSCKTV